MSVILWFAASSASVLPHLEVPLHLPTLRGPSYSARSECVCIHHLYNTHAAGLWYAVCWADLLCFVTIKPSPYQDRLANIPRQGGALTSNAYTLLRSNANRFSFMVQELSTM